MGTVTSLEIQKRDPNRVSVFLDGEFALGVPKIVAVRLRVGQALSAENLAALQAEAILEEARDKALRYLEYRPRSSAEIRRYLHGKDYSADITDTIVARLEAGGLLDDLAFARYWLEQRAAFKPRSHFALRVELAQKGVDRAIIDAALAEVDELEQARRAAEQRWGRWQHLPPDERRARLAAFLQRRGFRYDQIEDVLTEWERSGTDDSGSDQRSE